MGTGLLVMILGMAWVGANVLLGALLALQPLARRR
jgi:hypothetical protein